MDGDRIPTVGTHRGIGLHNHQTPARLAVVRGAIDQVADMGDVLALVAFAEDPQQPPEARLLAAHKVAVEFEMAAEQRENRPDVDLIKVAASTAGLDSVKWRSPWRYCSLLDWRHGLAVEREQPLVDE
jgi:hypothetical protein